MSGDEIGNIVIWDIKCDTTRNINFGKHCIFVLQGNPFNEDIVAFGCTSKGQAHRFGKWHILTEKLEKESSDSCHQPSPIRWHPVTFLQVICYEIC